MAFLVFLVHAFVNTFGITQPSAEGARRAARYVGVVLVLLLLLSIGVAFELRAVFSQ